MGIHVGSFTLGGIVGAGVMGYVIMKSPIGGEVKGRVLDVTKKKAEEGIHFLLWGEDKKSPCYSDFIRYDKKGRADYGWYATKSKDDKIDEVYFNTEEGAKIDEVYFNTEEGAKSVFSSVHDMIEEYGNCSIAKFLEVADKHMTKKSARELKMEHSDFKYGWDMHDLTFFNEEMFYSNYISGKGWRFMSPTVHKISL